MAPEQLLGQPPTAGSDQFSFCVALYQALYGELPFDGETMRERLAAIEKDRLRRPRASTEVPTWLREVISRGLKANPNARYPSMRKMLDELQYDPDDKAHWKLGFLYVNRRNPAVFVPKRLGWGWSLNFANPWAWAILAALVVYLVWSRSRVFVPRRWGWNLNWASPWAWVILAVLAVIVIWPSFAKHK